MRFADTPDKLEFSGQSDMETMTLEQLIAAHGSPFFIKIDVEGYEAIVLRGLQHAVPFLSYEVNLPEFRSEGVECVQMLSRLANDGSFNYTFDTRRGLCEKRWLGAAEISRVIEECAEENIEVFWRTKAGEARAATEPHQPFSPPPLPSLQGREKRGER